MKDFKFMSDFTFDLIVDSGERSADMLYATRLNLPDAFVYIAGNGQKIAIVSDLEYDRARANAPAGLIVRNQNEFGSVRTFPELLKRLQEIYHVKEFRIPFDFPAGLAAQLHRKGVI